jgi:hypothetical protein
MRLALFRGLNSRDDFVPENWLQVSGGNFMIGTTCNCECCDQIKLTRTRWVGDEKIVCEILIGKSKMRYSLGDVDR